jgi:phosphoglycolate phosphatase
MASLVQRIFPEEIRPADGPETDRILIEYRAAYDRHWKDTTSLFPGIGDLLDELNRREIPIGVLSNKAHDFTVKCVEAFLGDWTWTSALGSRNGVPRKPDPSAAIEAALQMGVDPNDCFFVGDSDVDMFTANNAAMHAIGVSWGFRSIEELESAGAETVIDHPIDLITVMKSMYE